MSARAEDAARALSREQPTTADAAVPAPANNGSADAEGVEIPAPEPSGNKNLLPGGIKGRSEELLRGRKLGAGAKLTFNVGPLSYAPSPSSASIPELVRECRTQFSLPLIH